ncbi:MAG: phosphatase PAP2 family protein [Acidobacteria bacterium]|nr:phosphatase PAP2 family protein [Acidobacteriota bacterium]
MREHGWRFTFAAGVNTAAVLYNRYVGFSREPLLFEDPPGFDKAVRATLKNPNDYNGFINRQSLVAFKVLGFSAIIGLDFGDRHEMANDMFGFADAILTNRGITSLVKNIVGRHRPGLEFADPNATGAASFDALNARRHYHRSFPSGHASGSFTMLSYLERTVARKVGLHSLARKFTFGVLYGMAGYVIYTRVDQDEHYLSDVLAGAALGTWEARTYYRLEHADEFADRVAERSARVVFHPPQILHGGAMMTVGIRFGADQP